MNTLTAYRGRVVTEADVTSIREIIASHPALSRRALSKKVCEAWNWVQPNGQPRDMVCRGLMLILHRAGHIELPPLQKTPPNPLARRARPPVAEVERAPLACSLRELRPLELEQVRRTPREPLFNSLLEHHHYLGYTQPVGEQLKYLVWAQGRPIACLAWSSAPRHLGCRDRFIGWSATAHRRNIHLLAYNLRFLILPWVRVPHLASHLLGAWRDSCPPTGSGSTDIRSTSSKRLWSRSDSAARATWPRTGFIWAGRPAAARMIRRAARIGRSRTCWDIRSAATSAADCVTRQALPLEKNHDAGS